MPQFLITAPNGKKYKVTGPDKEGALQALKQQLGDMQPASEPQTVAGGKTDRQRSLGETLTDVGMGAAQGIQSGIQSLVGLPGDARDMVGRGVGWVAGQFGASPEAQKGFANAVGNTIPGMSFMPTTEQVHSAVEGVIGPDYKTNTTAGKYAQTIGEFAPAAIAGPGGLARKTAMTVGPALLSEGAGQFTEGTSAEPYARVGGALAGAVLTGGRGNSGTKQMLKNVGNSDKAYAAVEKEANDLFTTLRNAGVKYDANAVDATIQDIGKIRMNPNLAPSASGLRDEVAKFAGNGIDFQDLNDLEIIAKGVMRHHTTTPTDKMFTGMILDKIKTIREKGAVVTNGSIPADQVNPLIAKANEVARRRIIARDIMKMKDKAEWYVSGPESGLRNQFASYGKKNGTRFEPLEEQAFNKVTNREGVLSIANALSNRVGQSVMGGLGLYSGQIIPALAGMIGTAATRKFMELYTRKGVENAIKTVLAGKDAQTKAAVENLMSRYEALQRNALSAQPGLQQGQQVPFLTDARGQSYDKTGKPLGQ